MTTHARVAKPKNATIQVRVTAAQQKALRAAAKRDGLDLAPWLRTAVIRLLEKGGTS